MRLQCCWPHDMHGAARSLAAHGTVQRAHCDSMQVCCSDSAVDVGAATGAAAEVCRLTACRQTPQALRRARDRFDPGCHRAWACLAAAAGTVLGQKSLQASSGRPSCAGHSSMQAKCEENSCNRGRRGRLWLMSPVLACQEALANVIKFILGPSSASAACISNSAGPKASSSYRMNVAAQHPGPAGTA